MSRAGIALALASALAACAGSAGSPPSSAEVAQAVGAVIASNYARFGGAGSGAASAPAPQVTHVQDLGCSPAPDGRGYLCETTIDTTDATQPHHQMTRLVRMVRSRSGWQAVME